MKYHLLRLFALTILTFSFTALAQAQLRPYTASDSQIQTLLTRIETRTDTFRRVVTNALDRSTLNNTSTEDSFIDYVTEFENSTDTLRQKFASRNSVAADVQDVLRRAAYINQFMQNNRLTVSAQNSWSTLRTDLNTLAQYYRVSWNWTNPTYDNDNDDTVNTLPYTVSDTNVRSLITRLETNTDNYRRQVTLDLDRSVLNNTKSEGSINAYITDFENSVDSLKRNFQSRRSTSKDVEDVLNHAYFIDTFMRDYRMSRATENSWRVIRTDLNSLSTYYSVNWNWNRPNQQANRLDRMLNGTYRLNVTESDNVAEVVDRSTTGTNQTIRERAKTNLERRLSSPNMLAIEKNGAQVTIASSTAPQVTFNADGVARTETNERGRAVKITATSNYDGVAINYEGERMNDFYVNFVPMSNGQLRVVRRVYLENRNETVTVASVYDKISPTARWTDIDNNNNTTYGSLNNTYVVPNNTAMTAVLTTAVSTKTSQNGDRFQMEVTSPSQYDGAIIEGRVAKTERSGRVSGRAQMSLEFDTIRLRNGQTYKFAGLVDSVTLANGNTVTVNNEGTVRDNNQTTKTVQRAGIGAAIGALIGAIAGGGKGAVIGAGVGAGAGAGTVILQGRDDVELENGTTFSITAAAPSNTTANR